MSPRTPDPAALFDLTGARAAVIGGTGVLGGRFAAALATAKADVAVLGRSAERAREVVDEVEVAGGNARFVHVDVEQRDSVEQAASVLAADGGLDVLVNAAGVNASTPFVDLDEAEWQHLLDVNLTAVFRSCQVFAPLMRHRPQGGSIINISSASSGPPLSKVLGYGVAKAGLNNLTQYLARELAADGIRVNAIVPGFFPAEQNRALLTAERIAAIEGHTPMGRLGRPEELIGTLLWLAAPAASGFVTGALVRVDGGFSAMTI